MKNVFASTKSKVITGVVATFVLLAAAAMSVFVYYGNHAFPGTTLAGHSVSGQSRDQVAATIEQLRAGQQVDIVSPDGDSVAVDFVEAGVFVSVSDSVDRVFADNSGFVSRITGIFGGSDIEPVVVANYALLDNYAQTVNSEDEAAAVDASVSYDAETAVFVVAPSADGAGIDTESLETDIIAAAQSLSSATIDATLVTSSPELTTEAAQIAADAANTWVGLQIEASDGDGSVMIAEPAVVAGWISFVPSNGGLEAEVNDEMVTGWVTAFADASNREVVNGVQNITQSGRIVATPREGSAGRTVDNVEAISSGILAALDSGSSYTGEFAYRTVEPSYDQRIIADGAENLSYMAAPDEKWIDINLSNYHVTAYEGATAVMRMPMVPGAPLTPTITGQYAVRAKVPIQTMRGNNVDGTKYETPNVPWVLYFHGGYATHGAYWRSSFGYDAGVNGSHGCVNLPVDSAKGLYDWASIGTTVVSHY